MNPIDTIMPKTLKELIATGMADLRAEARRVFVDNPKRQAQELSEWWWDESKANENPAESYEDIVNRIFPPMPDQDESDRPFPHKRNQDIEHGSSSQTTRRNQK